MSAEPNIRERLFDLCVGHGEWHIRKGDGICMTFSHSDSLDPEREAIAWLAEHQERYPERFAGYEVHRVTVQSELQLAALAVLDELDRLRATPAPGAPAGFKLVPVKVTKAMQDAWDSAPSSEDSDADFVGAYQAMLDAAPGAPGQEAAAVQAVGAAEQMLDRYATQADEIKELLDTHAPYTTGNIRARVAQLLLVQAAGEKK